MTRRTFVAAAALLSIASAASATTYNGNGNTGFGGTIGNGSLVLTDDGTNVYGTLNIAGTMGGNALVIYIMSTTGGFTSTAGFNDANDSLRSAISGYSGSGQSVMTFASGFAPNYAIALQPDSGVNFGGLWGLANGGNNSLPFISSVNLSPTGTDGAGAYTFSFSLASIGLTPGAGQSFELFGTYISDSGYRSSEAIAGNDTGSQGWNPFTQTAFSVYDTLAVPEPSSLALVGLGTAALIATRRRK